MTKADLGARLLEAGLVVENHLKEAQKIEKSQGGDVLTHLVKIGAIDQGQLLGFLGDHFGTASVNLDETGALTPEENPFFTVIENPLKPEGVGDWTIY